jgi:hypothetical protein
MERQEDGHHGEEVWIPVGAGRGYQELLAWKSVETNSIGEIPCQALGLADQEGTEAHEVQEGYAQGR